MFQGFEKLSIATRGATINLVKGGDGPPLLLLHGYPQTHVIWHKIAPRLAEHFTVIASDLRGYGDSSKPESDPEHANYSKREMAQDQVEVMESLGFKQFYLAGHDRGGRVAHRMALDHPERVARLAVLDIAPTYTMYTTADMEFATAYYHWFFLIQPADMPERLIGADPDYFLVDKLGKWGRDMNAFTPEALAEYLRCFSNSATIHASCEDYRASATIDLKHDETDLKNGKKLECPVLALWGAKGFVGHKYDVISTWQALASGKVSGEALPCGHYLPEEAPEQTCEALLEFFL
ncbi:MAG TPA: alpha/beta hydrolase [Chloroflexia bacterium]|nr:alpha/beta hydrolase [Chloroflexia bacterium]